MDAAIAPAIAMKLPWAAVIGNHDQEGTLSREGVMHHLVGMKNTLSRFNPEGVEIDGYGNYNLEVAGLKEHCWLTNQCSTFIFLTAVTILLYPQSMVMVGSRLRSKSGSSKHLGVSRHKMSNLLLYSTWRITKLLVRNVTSKLLPLLLNTRILRRT